MQKNSLQEQESTFYLFSSLFNVFVMDIWRYIYKNIYIYERLITLLSYHVIFLLGLLVFI